MKEEGTAADAEQTATCGCPQSGCGRGCGRLRLPAKRLCRRMRLPAKRLGGRLRLPAKQLSAAATVGEVAVGD